MMNLTIPTHTRARAVAQVLAAVALVCVTLRAGAITEPDQSKVAPPSGDGWQVLSTTPAAVSAPLTTTAPTTAAGSAASSSQTGMPVVVTAPASTDVASVVLPGTAPTPAGTLSFSVTPQDVNLRDALDRWLQQQGWQLAWKIDDDLPLEFNATFSGDFTSILTQVMQATNHMRTPTRVCRHTNNVIRVIARAANCQD